MGKGHMMWREHRETVWGAGGNPVKGFQWRGSTGNVYAVLGKARGRGDRGPWMEGHAEQGECGERVQGKRSDRTTGNGHGERGSMGKGMHGAGGRGVWSGRGIAAAPALTLNGAQG